MHSTLSCSHHSMRSIILKPLRMKSISHFTSLRFSPVTVFVYCTPLRVSLTHASTSPPFYSLQTFTTLYYVEINDRRHVENHTALSSSRTQLLQSLNYPPCVSLPPLSQSNIQLIESGMLQPLQNGRPSHRCAIPQEL